LHKNGRDLYYKIDTLPNTADAEYNDRMVISFGVQLALFLGTLAIFSPLLGQYIAWVMDHRESGIRYRVEQGLLRLCGIDTSKQTDWKTAIAITLQLSGISLGLWGILGIIADSTPSITQLVGSVGLTPFYFLSAAIGIAVTAQLARGLRSHTGTGSIWRDISRAVLWILLPLCLGASLFFAATGTPQPIHIGHQVMTVDRTTTQHQSILLTPMASVFAVQTLSGVPQSALPVHQSLQTPTPVSGLVHSLLLVLLPTSLCFAFGRWARLPDLGEKLFGLMLIVLATTIAITFFYDRQTPVVADIQTLLVGGTMDGKFQRLGIPLSAIDSISTAMTTGRSIPNTVHHPVPHRILIGATGAGSLLIGSVGVGLIRLVFVTMIVIALIRWLTRKPPEYLGKAVTGRDLLIIIVGLLLPLSVEFAARLVDLSTWGVMLIIVGGRLTTVCLALYLAAQFSDRAPLIEVNYKYLMLRSWFYVAVAVGIAIIGAAIIVPIMVYTGHPL